MIKAELKRIAKIAKKDITKEDLKSFENILKKDNRVSSFLFAGIKEDTYLYSIESTIESGVFSIGRISNKLYITPIEALERQKNNIKQNERHMKQNEDRQNEDRNYIQSSLNKFDVKIKTVQYIANCLSNGVRFKDNTENNKAEELIIYNQKNGKNWFIFFNNK